MQEERIRLAKTNSVTSDNKESFVDIDLKQHSRLFPFDDVIDTIDQMQQFEKERKECNKYRLILTINPYCTNILFNAVSEIVQNEGTPDKDKLVIANKLPITLKSETYKIKGKSKGVTNYDMVRNTEYCNCDSPFVYHCGYDIFNNHILRNMTFKPVNDYSGSSSVTDFNTISDYMRNASGKNIKLSKRIIEEEKIKIKEEKKRHLYLKEDILNYTDSINVNLYEKNGWWGFSNTSNITTKYAKTTKEMPISRVFNNEDLMGCGFVEMYPDSSLYSFSPKYNSLQNREEYNWDICITYPYECEYQKVLVNGNTANENVNAMLIAETTLATGTSGQSIILFRTFVKHNLNVGDYVRLFYEKDSVCNEIQGRRFRVVNIGNLKSEYQDYYFYINDAQYIIEKLEAENDANKINKTTFRFIKVVNDIDCKYYYRKFKKLPNFKFKEKELTDEVAQDNGKLKQYINDNCKKSDGKMVLFNKEQYPLAFSNTIYNDGKTQVVFTDSIDIDKLTDNLGRPLTELYVTIIKRNKGYDTWYKVDKTPEQLKNIEFSHCFGRVDSGLKIHGEYKDSDFISRLRENVNDVCLIRRKDKDKDNLNLDNNITIDSDEFYGDVVELNQETLNETVLSDVCFRFNTAQREHNFKTAIDKEDITFDFSYDEIKTDDYDYAGFECEKKVLFDNTENNNNIRRDEGYYYKAHYPFKVRRFGTLRQGSHQTIPVETCNIRQSHGLIIEVVSSIRSGVTHGSVVYLCDVDTNKKIAEFTVNNIQNQVRFAINYPPTYIDNVTPNIYDIVNGLRYRTEHITQYGIWTDEDGIEHFVTDKNGEDVNNYANPRYKLLLRNVDIPFYAREIDNSNVYLWRDITNDTVVEDGKEIEYPFANGHIYINKEINFFLKRQDPFGYNGLYSQNKNPIDIIGNMRKENNYEYKDETNIVC